MPKYIISWEVGNYGENQDIIEAKDLDEAQNWAYEVANEKAQGLISSNAEEYSKERAQELGLEEIDDVDESADDSNGKVAKP